MTEWYAIRDEARRVACPIPSAGLCALSGREVSRGVGTGACKDKPIDKLRKSGAPIEAVGPFKEIAAVDQPKRLSVGQQRSGRTRSRQTRLLAGKANSAVLQRLHERFDAVCDWRASSALEVGHGRDGHLPFFGKPTL